MKTKYLLPAIAIMLLMASPALAADSPPALPSLPPDTPTTGDSTTTTVDTTTTTTGTGTTGTTASGTSSGPVETTATIALALIAFWGIKKYLTAKKYRL